jgi:hypothetical protein
MERVSIRRGRNNIIVVAPHGPDDYLTAEMASHLAHSLDTYMVVNNGFKKSLNPDSSNDIGDCNRIDHFEKDFVMHGEFLEPLLRYKKIITNKDEQCFILYIHGFGQQTIKSMGKNVDLIIGYGLGSVKNSLTCEKWRKDILQYNLELRDDWVEEATIHVPGMGSFKNDMDRKWDIYIAGKRSAYAARNLNNLCQYFSPLSNNYARNVHALQLEFAPHLRKNLATAIDAMNFFGQALMPSYYAMKRNHEKGKHYVQEKFISI